jgi:hypothetical protein
MKILWIMLSNLVLMGFQPVMAYEDTLPGQLDAGKNQATRQGQENSQPGRANNVPPKPWETRPWEKAQKDVRPGGLRQNDGQKAEELRRVGRKARKERLERQKEKTETLSYQERVKQRQTKWQRHQLGSERYFGQGVPQK